MANLILLADDDVMLRNLIRMVLEGEGYNVLAAANGDEALQLFRENRADVSLLLSDIEMPVLDGPAAFHRMRIEKPELRVLFMSGKIVTSDLPEPWPLLAKPFRMDLMVSTVHSLLTPKPS